MECDSRRDSWENSDLRRILCVHGIVMNLRTSRSIVGSLLLAVGLMAAACTTKREVAPGTDPELATRGSIDVTARLVEIPEGAIFERELYNYATVLKYEVLEVHRGKVKGQTIYVGHYNPFKPRPEAADRRVHDVGGNLKSFRAGEVHRMALEESMLDHFTGGSSTSIPRKTQTRSTGPSGRIWPAVNGGARQAVRSTLSRSNGLPDRGLHDVSAAWNRERKWCQFIFSQKMN